MDGLIVYGLVVGPAAGELREIGQEGSEDAAGSRRDAVWSSHVVRAWNRERFPLAATNSTKALERSLQPGARTRKHLNINEKDTEEPLEP